MPNPSFLDVKMAKMQWSLAYKKPPFGFSLLFCPFSQKLSVSVSYKVASYMRDSHVQTAWLVAMVTKISRATITGNDCFRHQYLHTKIGLSTHLNS